MKRSVIIGLFVVLSVFSLSGVFADGCDLQVSMINQDPYPALQGEEVKVVFQVDGIAASECGTVEFGLVEKYPISFDPDQQEVYVIESGTFQKDYQSFFLAPYTLRVSENALDGDNVIEVKYRKGFNSGYETKDFKLNVKDTRADFEIYLKNYDLATRTLTLEILNTAESDVYALTLEISNQDNIEVKGSKSNIVGDLDSTDYTTADFEAVPKAGEFNVKVSYTDSTGERRVLEKVVLYESEYFEDRVADQSKSKVGTYVFLFIIVALIVWWVYRRRKKKMAMQKKLARK